MFGRHSMKLRELKKERTRTAILDAARKLFFRNGFGNTTIEDIASTAEVAVGTVYNYFDSKNAIVLGLTELDTASVTDSIPVNGGTGTVEDTILTLIDRFVLNLTRYPKSLMRELIGAAYNEKNLTAGLMKQDLAFIDDLAARLDYLWMNGKLREDTDIQHASLAIYGIVTMTVLWFAADEDRTIDQTRESLKKMLHTFCRGLLPEGRK